MLPKNTVDPYLHLKKRLDKAWRWFLIFWTLQFLLLICLMAISIVAFVFILYNPQVVLELILIMVILFAVFGIVQEPKKYFIQTLERIREELEHQVP